MRFVFLVLVISVFLQGKDLNYWDKKKKEMTLCQTKGYLAFGTASRSGGDGVDGYTAPGTSLIGLGVTQYVCLGKGSKWKGFADLNMPSNSDVSFMNISLGGERELSPIASFDTYAGVGLGISQMTWKKDLLRSSTTKDFKSSSVASILLTGGGTKKLTDKLLLDLDLKYLIYSHKTALSDGTNSGSVEDRNSILLNVGVRYLY